ncbi:unnamed protein product [Blepharisma stoltei]|uniref:Uncharacterized protein n=1 Tax=Blepharisma stoltei TaxID=1481888 RepID=A0AAU9IYZ1_9CILI|nr:unnamed protein product [Blepharisma stoltei]
MSGDESFAKRLQDIEWGHIVDLPQKGNEEIKQPAPLEINEKNDKPEPAQTNNHATAPAEISEDLLTIKKFGDWNFRFSIVDGILVLFYGVGGLFILFSLAVLPIFFASCRARLSQVLLNFSSFAAILCFGNSNSENYFGNYYKR